MGLLREKLINALGGVAKTNNSGVASGRDFLRYGNRTPLAPEWSEVTLSDKDLYKGYPYAAIQRRSNMVAKLAKKNLKTWCNAETVDAFQDLDEVPYHPYLTLIENSTTFSQKQFWKIISIYLDLAGRFYLGVVRNSVQPANPNLRAIITDVKEFVLLNPYEVKRVVNKEGELAGYIERKKDGRYREWPVYQIIEMKDLNPLDWDSQWSMMDAAKDSVYTLEQSGDYTRQSLDGNLKAPGIISTDIILEDNDFANFKARVREHRKGEPLFANGSGAITWQNMQIDLDKAALFDINEISRSTFIAVSGTSKTTLGIEESGTTRETSRTQTDNFISETAQPRLEDIIDWLNLDYKRYYPREYKQTGYLIEVNDGVSKDYDTAMSATQVRDTQFDLAQKLVQAGYTWESSVSYAKGEIELSDLERDENTPELPTSTDEPPIGPKGDGPDPTGDIEDDKKEQNSVPKVEETSEGELVFAKDNNENHIHTCDCEECKKGQDINTYINAIPDGQAKELKEAYNRLLNEIQSIQKETIDKAIEKVDINTFVESDIITKKDKETLLKRLKNAFKDYWWLLFPLFANILTDKRNKEFGQSEKFVFSNEIQDKITNNANRVSESHLHTILDDVLEASNKAYTGVVEKAASQLILDAYDKNPSKFSEYFDKKPTEKQALKAIQNTDILEKNKKIYDKANKMAAEGYDRQSIVNAIRKEYSHLSETRAVTIARNETSRAFTQSQYQADYQFLKSINQLENAYKELYSRSGDPCKVCQTLIERGPIPFTKNFLDKGESLTFDNGQKTQTFVANWENIEAGVVHVNCQCEYRLIIRNNGVENVYNSIESSVVGDNFNDFMSNSSNNAETKKLNGGPGSGFHGHLGRKGLVGGSSKGGQGFGTYEEVYNTRQEMYDNSDDFQKANSWLNSVKGSGGDIFKKAEDIGFDPEKEINLSKKIQGNKKETVYRYQEGVFDPNARRSSRWSTEENLNSDLGSNKLTTTVTKANILLHPKVLYSTSHNETALQMENEYVLDNSKINIQGGTVKVSLSDVD